MIYSMTGYGKAVASLNQQEIHVELRSLNSRYLDFNPKLPKALSVKEQDIRQRVVDSLQRGKVSMVIEITGEELQEELSSINLAQLKHYISQLGALETDTDLLDKVLLLPGVVTNASGESESSEALWKSTQAALDEALAACLTFRQQEGESILLQLKGNLQAIRQGLDQVAELEPRRLPRIRERIQKNLDEWVGGEQYDQNRLEQELIYYIEKLDITEEKTRLLNHIGYFESLLDVEETQLGKKLNFLAQEMGREINTLGSKANDSGIQQVVVTMKEELEQIKEQVLNIL